MIQLVQLVLACFGHILFYNWFSWSQRKVRAVLEVVSLGLIRTVEDLEGRFARRCTGHLIIAIQIH